MNEADAIISFSQSDKVKGALICVTQSLEAFQHLPEAEKPGAAKMIRIFINTIQHDIHIGQQASADHLWDEIEKGLDMAIVMIDSGVPQEATFHLSQTLSKVTTIAQRSMSYLKQKGLL